MTTPPLCPWRPFARKRRVCGVRWERRTPGSARAVAALLQQPAPDVWTSLLARPGACDALSGWRAAGDRPGGLAGRADGRTAGRAAGGAGEETEWTRTVDGKGRLIFLYFFRLRGGEAWLRLCKAGAWLPHSKAARRTSNDKSG